MPRVVPSDVVKAADRMFPEMAKDPKALPGMDVSHVSNLVALARLVEAMPDQLIVLDPPHYAAPLATLRAGGAPNLTRDPDANIEKWDLHEYTEVAARLGIIKADTAAQVRLARTFRNLIHPGRVQRLGQKADRFTALSALAA